MSSKGFAERVLEVYEDGPTIATSNAEASLLPDSANDCTFGAGAQKIGKVLKFKISLAISTLVTTPGTFQVAVKMDAVQIFATGQLPLNIISQSNVPMVIEGELVCRAVGKTNVTKFMPKCCWVASRALVGSGAAGTSGVGVEPLPYNAAPAVGSGVDFTVSHQLDISAQFSVSNAANSVTLKGASVDVYS